MNESCSETRKIAKIGHVYGFGEYRESLGDKARRGGSLIMHNGEERGLGRTPRSRGLGLSSIPLLGTHTSFLDIVM